MVKQNLRNYIWYFKKKGSISIIKTIFNSFSVSPFVILFALFSVFMGAFVPFLLLMLIVIVHELGHFLCAIFLKVPVDHICIYPFGGIAKVHSEINIPLKKELLILIMGPLVQIVFMIFFKNYLPEVEQEMFLFYNYYILAFNLLPVYPLDGGKILNIIFSYHFSYRKSFTLSLVFSVFVTVFFFLVSLRNLKLNLILLVVLLFSKIYGAYKQRGIDQERFLLERYLVRRNFRKRCQVECLEDFRRDYIHLVKGKCRYQTEKEALKMKFQIY